jgi:hypothetical protein
LPPITIGQVRRAVGLGSTEDAVITARTGINQLEFEGAEQQIYPLPSMNGI